MLQERTCWVTTARPEGPCGRHCRIAYGGLGKLGGEAVAGAPEARGVVNPVLSLVKDGPFTMILDPLKKGACRSVKELLLELVPECVWLY